jgi:hypothetical protein
MWDAKTPLTGPLIGWLMNCEYIKHKTYPTVLAALLPAIMQWEHEAHHPCPHNTTRFPLPYIFKMWYLINCSANYLNHQNPVTH